jgi:hypothetical protein
MANFARRAADVSSQNPLLISISVEELEYMKHTFVLKYVRI